MPPARQSMLCPHCRKIISTREARCPHCGTSRPASLLKSGPWTALFYDAERLVGIVIGVNVGFYILSLALDLGGAAFTLNPFAFLSPSNENLFLLGATGRLPIDGLRLDATGIPFLDRLLRWATLVSANYLHGSLLHILFNMLVLRQIAVLAAREYGPARLFVIYTLGGVAGFLVSYLAGVAYTIGASAAVCALMGALVYFGRSRGGVYGNEIYRQIGGWAVGLLIIGLLPGINNWGHGGGFLAGIALGWLLGYQERRPEGLGQRLLAGVCALVTAGVLAWSAGFAITYRLLG